MWTRVWSRLWSHRGLIVVWWLAGLGLALVAVLPLRFALARFFGTSLAEAELREALRVSHVVDFLASSPTTLAAITGGGIAALLIWTVASLLLSAGTVGVLVGPGSGVRGFGAAAGSWFFPFLRLELAALLLVPLVGLPLAGTALFVEVVGGDLPSEPLEWWATRVGLGLALLTLVVVRITVRFARIEVVRAGERSALRSLRRGISCTRRRWLAALLWSIGVAVVAVMVLSAEAALAELVVASSAETLLALVLAQQALALVRTTARLLRTTAEVELCLGLSAEETHQIEELAAHLAVALGTGHEVPGIGGRSAEEAHDG